MPRRLLATVATVAHHSSPYAGIPSWHRCRSRHPVSVAIGGLYVQSSQVTVVLSRTAIRCPILWNPHRPKVNHQSHAEFSRLFCTHNAHRKSRANSACWQNPPHPRHTRRPPTLPVHACPSRTGVIIAAHQNFVGSIMAKPYDYAG